MKIFFTDSWHTIHETFTTHCETDTEAHYERMILRQRLYVRYETDYFGENAA